MPPRNRQLDDDLHPMQLEILRKMSDSERVALWNDMTRTTLELSFLNIQRTYPDACEQEQKYRFASLLYGKELASQVYGDWP